MILAVAVAVAVGGGGEGSVWKEGGGKVGSDPAGFPIGNPYGKRTKDLTGLAQRRLCGYDQGCDYRYDYFRSTAI